MARGDLKDVRAHPGLVLALAVVIAGCTQAPDTGRDTIGTLEPTLDPQAGLPNETWQLGGSNVSWLAAGTTTFPINVPEGVAALAHGVTCSRDCLMVQGVISGGPCPDGDLGPRLGAGAHRWCDNPTPGNYSITIRMDAGTIAGRVCVTALPVREADLGRCIL